MTRLRCPRQCMRIDVLPDFRHLAASYGDGEDPVVRECLVRSFDLPRRNADHENPISVRYVFRRIRKRRFHRF